MSDRPEWDLRLGYLIHDVSRLRRMMFDRALAPLGITSSQWWVLAFISRKDGLPQTQLANELDVGKVGVGARLPGKTSQGDRQVQCSAHPRDRPGGIGSGVGRITGDEAQSAGDVGWKC